MPVATSAQRTTREIRQQQILDAAVHVFSQQGYHAASMDGVAEAEQFEDRMARGLKAFFRYVTDHVDSWRWPAT